MELKHIVWYLPYGLKCICESTNNKDDSFNFALEEISAINGVFAAYEWYSLSGACIKPILRPISDLTKEIEVNGERFVPIEKLKLIIDEFGNQTPNIVFVKCFSGFFFEWYSGSQISIRRSVPMCFYEKLYEWHFDLHSLIEKGQAIDINQLKK